MAPVKFAIGMVLIVAAVCGAPTEEEHEIRKQFRLCGVI